MEVAFRTHSQLLSPMFVFFLPAKDPLTVWNALPVWFSGNALASINVVAQRQTLLAGAALP